MKKLGKRTLAMLLAAVMLLTLIPTGAFASDERAASAEEKMELSDGYINVAVSNQNGGFLIATEQGNRLDKSDDNKELLYPSADYDTSYTSIRVTRTDGSREDYVFGRKYGFLGIDSSDVRLVKSGNSIIATWSVKDITVTQTLGLLDESAAQHGMVSISYGVTSTSNDIADVKIRIMLDTALGEQDFGYYQVPNKVNEYQSVVRETLLVNSGAQEYNNTFFAMDDPNMPKVNAYTVDTTVDGQKIRPYQVAFGHWNSLASSVFDFTPDPSINFTNQYNCYRTADSAYALYYDLGALEAGKTEYISTYYGVYSNASVSDDASVSINFTSIPASMTLKEEENAYLSQVQGGRDGDVQLKFLVKNQKDYSLENVTVVIKTMNNIIPYKSWGFHTFYEEGENYTQTRTDVKPGEELSFDVYFNVTPLSASEYRYFEILCYAAGEDETLTENKLLGSRKVYLFCPGELGEVVVFNSISPQVIHYEGTRRLYLSGQNIGLMQDTTAYTTILRPVAGGEDVIVPSKKVVVDKTNNSMYLIIEEEMNPGGYQVIFDWVESGKEDTTATALQFQVSTRPEYIAPTYGVVTIERVTSDLQTGSGTYQVKQYENRMEYEAKVADPDNTVLLEFYGRFGARYDEQGNLVELKAASLTDVYGKLINSINISNCVIIEDGFVSINIENPQDEDNQCINIDIEGKVYTSGSRTLIWDGVCAITSIENGGKYHLMQYAKDGSEVEDVEGSSANTDVIQLIWPGAASTAQTLAGVIFEFRYCQFAMIANEDAEEITDETPKERVISFGAQMSPNFLLPKNFDWGDRKTSALEVVQLKMAKSNYTASQLRDVQQRYAYDQQSWEEVQRGTLNLYVNNILFGQKGFIGFNAAVEVGLPSYVNGMPEIEGTLELKIMPALNYWEVGVEGEADFVALKMEAALTLVQADGGAPGMDKYYFYVEGNTPGINVDGYGVFWIQGLGGGIDHVYDTIYSVSKVPPISIMLSGKFALFALLEARADMSISLRELSVSLSNIGFKGVNLIDYAGMDIRWYPDFYLKSSIYLDILDMIEGGGYIAVERNEDTDSYFWEGFAKATIHTPDLPIIGQITIGGAAVGVNTNKIWGALTVIGIDMGLTYYWGGDVDFGFGKYNAPEPTYPIGLVCAKAGVDEETGKELYVCLGTNATLLASTQNRETATGGNGSIVSSVDRRNHVIDLGSYASGRNHVLTVTYAAESEEEAWRIVNGDAYGRNGLVLTAENNENKNYPLRWMDKTKDASKQTDANAIFSYNAQNQKASVTISFTDADAYAQKWKLSTGESADLALYEMRKMAGLDSADYTMHTEQNRMTVTWTGNQIEDMDTITVYAQDTDGNRYPLYQTEELSVISNGSVSFSLPADLKSGTYTIQVVGSSEANNVCSIAEATGQLNYINQNQPSDPVIDSIRTGGDYSIIANVSTTDAVGSGYAVTVYEKKNGSWEPCTLGTQYVEAEADGSYPTSFTIGGQYDTIVYTDEQGNILSAEAAKGRTDVNQKTVTLGLEAGKTYRLGVMAYRQDADGNELFSNESYSDEIVMVSPIKANVTVAAEGAVTITDIEISGSSEPIDFVADDTVTFRITSDMAVNGTWSLDSGARKGTFFCDNTATLRLGDSTDENGALTEGEHMLSLTGTNAAGDAFHVDYRFHVWTTTPRLQLSSPYAGAFYGNTVLVTGISDPYAKVYVSVDGAEAGSDTADEKGEFSIAVAMDTAKYSQVVSVYAQNALGTRSYQHNLKLYNGVLENADVRLAIYLDGEDYTGKTIPAGSSGKVALYVCAGEVRVAVPENSLLGNQAEWSLQMMEGNGSLRNGILTTNAQANGLLLVEMEGYDVAVVVGGNRAEDNSGEEGIKDSGYTVSAPDANGWWKQDVIIAAKNGYQLSMENTADAVWTNQLLGTTEGKDEKITFYVKEVATGIISEAKTEHYRLDKAFPIIGGIENGKTYYTTPRITITEENIASITVNGETVNGEVVLSPSMEGSYTILVTDYAGNSTRVTVTMKKTASVADAIAGITLENVTSAKKTNLLALIEQLDVLMQETSLNADEKQILEEIYAHTEELLERIELAAAAIRTESIQEASHIQTETAKPEDKPVLENAEADFDSAWKKYAGNYTEEEKNAILNEQARILAALEHIKQLEASVPGLGDREMCVYVYFLLFGSIAVILGGFLRKKQER